MKKNLLFEQCLANMDQEVREEVRLNMDIVNQSFNYTLDYHYICNQHFGLSSNT